MNSQKSASSSSYSSRKPPADKGKNIEKNAGKSKEPKGFQFLPPIGENETKGFEYGSPWDIFNYQGGGVGYSSGEYASPAHSTRTTRIVKGWGESGCVVAAMAGVTGKDYGDVRPIAMKHAVILKGEYIYDNNKSGPVHRSNYQIMENSYIELI